ncbi:MAG: DUF1667 domain-containing protein [Lentisphaeria bacterium]|nr:DUF1667 domain-containing protein [Lentisphaeria bacterium]
MEKENKVIRDMVCIMCPASCHLEVREGAEKGEYDIHGNQCPGGKKYALNEMCAPKRIVTAVVSSDSKCIACIPVKTDQSLPMELIEPLLQELYQMKISVPVRSGDILIKNYKNTGVDIVITRSVEK